MAKPLYASRSQQLKKKSSSGASKVSGEEAQKVIAYLASHVSESVSVEMWNAGLGDFVREQLLSLNLTYSLARRLAWELSQLGAFCIAQGMALDVERVLHPDTVERIVTFGLKADYSDTSRSTIRADLRALGPALTKKAPWEPPPEGIKRKSLPAPYPQSELRRIMRDINGQKTPARTHAARALIALGLGAGLDGRWNSQVRGIDIRRDGSCVVVNVSDPAARIVVVRKAFEDDLLELADAPLIAPRSRGGRNLSATLAAKIVIDQGAVRINAGRLCSTWLVAHLAAGTRMPELLTTAGVSGFGSFDDLLPFVSRLDVDRARSVMRSA